MQSDETHRDAPASRAAPDGAVSGPVRMSRRQAIGRLSAVATAGAAAWVVPEILTAKPAGGATLSGPAVLTEPATVVAAAAAATPATPATSGVTTAAATTPSSSLAYTGLNLQRDTEIGVALIAGGWAMQHWASRKPEGRPTE